MAKHLRYYLERVSTEGHVIRAEILQEAAAAFIPQELGIGAGDPALMIEWAETDKISPVQGSTATLIVNAPSDRELLDLARSIKAGEVRLDIYRDGSLWWSGTLDSEPYEEPYTDPADYDVQLDFSDLGVLNRIPWVRRGRESFADILAACLDAAGIVYGELVWHVSTLHGDLLNEGRAIDWSQVILDNENFYDEEGEALSCMEVLKGILQPFALRIIQRAGKMYIYDLNAACGLAATDVRWIGADAVLGYDVVYNDAAVRFSPYADDSVLDGAVKVSDKTGGGTAVKTSYDSHDDEVLDGFIIRHGSAVTAEGPVLENGAAFFDIESQYSGPDASGVLWGYKRGDAALSGGTCRQVLNAPGSCFAGGTGSFVGRKIATFPLRWLNYVSPVGGVRSKYRLRINLDLLFDVRYNPFEEAGDYNEKKNYSTMVSKCGFVWLPVMVTLRDAAGNALYHLENAGLALGTQKYSSRNGTRWVPGEGSPGCFFLAYYNHEDRRGKSGIGGWTTNRRCIGYYTDELPSSWAKMEAGEYVDLPQVGGYLEMSVYSGFHIRNRDVVTSIYDLVRWVAYKDARITLVRKNGLAIDLADQEDVAYVNADAQERCSVDTIVGTLSPDVPTATGRGLIFSGTMMHERFRRGGVTDRLEKLLLGTVYSQYAERCQKLSGTVELLEGFVLSDTLRTDGKYILAEDKQDMLDDTSNMTMTEVGPDEYEGIEYE